MIEITRKLPSGDLEIIATHTDGEWTTADARLKATLEAIAETLDVPPSAGDPEAHIATFLNSPGWDVKHTPEQNPDAIN